MDSFSAFARGEASRDKPLMVFDWHKAAKLIKENKPKTASAGLESDWEWTGGEIYSNGEIIMSDYTYLSSTWATPQLDMDGEITPCWLYQNDCPENWDSGTKWPESAQQILNA